MGGVTISTDVVAIRKWYQINQRDETVRMITNMAMFGHVWVN